MKRVKIFRWVRCISQSWLSRAAKSAVPVFVAVSLSTAQDHWMLGPFVKVDTANPCLTPTAASRFVCPIREQNLAWEAKDVFNPAAVVRGTRVYLLYRAQDSIGKPAGTSRIGLAWSTDGLKVTKHPVPVLYPQDDFMKRYEWEGGCEDPRVVQDEKGVYVMTYTAFDSRLARLAVATSDDLLHWRKQGLAFEQASDGKYRDRWSKSGSIISKRVGDNLVAVRIGGRYWMYWGESNIFMATSDNLIHWTPLEKEDGELAVAIGTRQNSFDSGLVEPGPPAVVTDAGIVFIYNSSNRRFGGDPDLPPRTYAAGQALFSTEDPTRLLNRTTSSFLRPEKEYELSGQVNNVCFLEGLVHFNGRWLLYYGTADSRIAVASSPP